MPLVSADELLKDDFQKDSFSKTIDYFDYARAYALLNGLPKPNDNWHANVYTAYVNKTGLQMLYAGLLNISLVDQAYLTIPMQSILLHYKTDKNNRDALVASNFLMIMGFNDTGKSIYQDSPDKNDTLWASFSLGVNLQEIFPNIKLPSFTSKAEIYPLASSNNGLAWKWGMRYSNLTALWTTTQITGQNGTETSKPFGLATYDELTFNYTLNIDPNTHKATISQDFIIGRMRDLWVFGGWFIIWPIYNHYNNTGCYSYNTKVSNETIYQFLYRNKVKMSIVEYQTSIIFDRSTYSTSYTGQNVTDRDVLVSDSEISTYADGGEKILDTSFGVKQNYNLFNYTQDSSEKTANQYVSISRTSQTSGFSKNSELFKYQSNFAKYLPLLVMRLQPQLYEKAKDTIANMTRADYLYLISYPSYSGYRVEHDPVTTIYFAPTITQTRFNQMGFLIIGGLVASIIMIIIVLKKRH
ncbi:MAG: hypothetical protein QG670_1815 [Thermoproteota archaeon]|nr:hypothetical protein [Thermoproteota archaeon]